MPSQCICGVQLSPNAHKASVNACKGGQDNVAVYSIVSRDDTHKQGIQSGSKSLNIINSASTTKQLATTRKPTSPSKTDTKDKDTAATQTIKSQETPPSVGPYEPKKPVSASMIIAIIFSLVGAIALAACVLLYYRARKRKQGVQNTLHEKFRLDQGGRRQPVPDPIIMAAADIHSNISNIPAPEYRRDDDKDGGRGSISSGTEYRNHRLLPTTPGLESGGKFPADLHARTGAFAARAGSGPGPGLDSRTTMSKSGNGLHSPSTGDVRPGPGHPRMNAPAVAGAGGEGGRGREREREGERAREKERAGGRGGTIATVPRQSSNGTNGNAPPTPPKPTTHERAASSSGLTSPPTSASTAGLGERAWHHQKLSTPYQPDVGLEIGPGAGRSSRGTIARSGPPSGPPSSLPPMPPIKPGMRTRPSGACAGPMSMKPVTTETGGNRNRPPARPQRRSFEDAVPVSETLPARSTNTYTSDIPAALKTGAGRGGDISISSINSSNSKGNALGMSHANASTPTLGRYGSISSKRGHSMAESPVLGFMTMLGGEQWGVPLPPRGTGTGRGTGRENRREEEEGNGLAGREPKIPVLPPVAPGERFDHRRWEGTLYAQPPHEGGEREVSRERGRRDGDGGGDGDGDWSPVSNSSVGTSILFGLEELDRRL